MHNVLAVDGDILAYRTAAVCENDFEGACEAIIDSTLKNISTDTGVHDMRIYLSGKHNFRHNIAKTKPYKGNRDGMVKPRFLDHCKEYLVKQYFGIQMHGYEADDGIASDMTQTGAIHCGIDKDILQIPGRHYNYVKQEWLVISEDEAKLRLYRQVLMGDASDNVPGLPKVGEKTAEKVITCADTAMMDALDYYRQICQLKLPDVDYFTYFSEQLSLIQMKSDISVFEIDFNKFVTVNPEDAGFTEQEGDFNG